MCRTGIKYKFEGVVNVSDNMSLNGVIDNKFEKV